MKTKQPLRKSAHAASLPSPGAGARPVDVAALEELVRPAVQGQGYELVDLTWKREPGGWVLRLLIDRPAGAGRISHHDCVSVSREVSALLDVHDPIPGPYNLEVSSPGVDRPLKRLEDFQRFVGCRARVRLRQDAALPGAAGARHRRGFTGTIEAIEGDRVRLRVDGEGVISLSIGAMERANVICEF
ncbi:MAG: ribosome maturation factor RimP [Myxococcales bacterium]|nr:ribosome maturation factor RimP [Myxococcota bacterium]MDW8280868.1 ribosome maturation factor RimP [Myxococcales bacterium]